MGFSFSSRVIWKRRRIARLDHAEEGAWESVDLLNEQRIERSKLGMIWDSAYPPSCRAPHEGGYAKNPKYGPGRPRQKQPRVVKALRYGLQVTLHEQAEVIARKVQELGCFVLLTNVPTKGEMAHKAREVLRVYKEQHGVEQNFAFLKDPVIVNSLFLKKPERIEALGLVLLLALLLWRLVERALRLHVETTGSTLMGWDKKETQKPTAFMLMTKFAAVFVVKVGACRQLAQPLSAVQHSYLSALGVSTGYFTLPPSR
jgi:hypothetical protein